MNHRLIAAAVAFGTCISLAAAQPVPPRNLRLGSGPKPVPPPECQTPPAGGPSHAYFDALVKRSEHLCNWSLRSQAQLNSLVADPVAAHFTYDPLNDTYADRQDAAKFVRTDGGSASIPGTQKMKFNIR